MDVAVQALKTGAERKFADLFVAAEDRLPGASQAWVARLRAGAIASYGTLGLPHRRIEDWKYTDLRARISDAYASAVALGAPIEEAEIVKALGGGMAHLESFRVVFVEGAFRPELSDFAGLNKAGVEILSLADALEKPPSWLKSTLGQINPPRDNAVYALNTGLMTHGALIRAPDGVALPKPIHLIHLDGPGEPVGSIARHVITIGKGAKACILESYAGLGGRGVQRNVATELCVGDDAEVCHVKYEREGAEATHLATWMTTLGANSRYVTFHFSMGASLARSELHVRFAGEGATADISGASMLKGKQHGDTTMVVDHAVPHCSSRELFKAVLDDEARAVFQGKLIVRQHAQKTDAKQMAQALLLSEAAEFDSKPELEIFADDVACGHGSTAGQIDEDLLFYLRARGLPEREARALLIQAFIGDALTHVIDDEVRTALESVAADWLGVKL